MSALEGRPAWETLRRHHLDTLAEALVELHSVPLEALTRVRPIERYEQPPTTPPPHSTTKPAVWERAFEIFHGGIPADDLTFVHRDFHRGNLLWTRTRLTGIVDWQAACVGPASIDVGHCRLIMTYYDPLQADPLQADRLRTAWERASGRTYDPWPDVMSIVGALDSFRTPRLPVAQRPGAHPWPSRGCAHLLNCVVPAATRDILLL